MSGFEGRYIAGDWGTSHLRLYLVEGGRLLARLGGPGLAALAEPIPDALHRLINDWRHEHGPLPVLLSGMAGSNIGWREAPYLPCPLDFSTLAGAAARLASGGQDIFLLPGARCTSPFGLADYMRGEETQIAGLLAKHPEMQSGRHLLCLPGTHNKWALIEDGLLRTFFSSLTGELYALLRRHSILLRDVASDAPLVPEAFALGVSRSDEAAPGGGFLQKLFETRARRIAGELTGDEAQSFLSGLLIGSDVRGAKAAFADLREPGMAISVIASSDLARAYELALGELGIQARLADGDEMSLQGLIAASDILAAGERIFDAALPTGR